MAELKIFPKKIQKKFSTEKIFDLTFIFFQNSQEGIGSGMKIMHYHNGMILEIWNFFPSIKLNFCS